MPPVFENHVWTANVSSLHLQFPSFSRRESATTRSHSRLSSWKSVFGTLCEPRQGQIWVFGFGGPKTPWVSRVHNSGSFGCEKQLVTSAALSPRGGGWGGTSTRACARVQKGLQAGWPNFPEPHPWEYPLRGGEGILCQIPDSYPHPIPPLKIYSIHFLQIYPKKE